MTFVSNRPTSEVTKASPSAAVTGALPTATTQPTTQPTTGTPDDGQIRLRQQGVQTSQTSQTSQSSQTGGAVAGGNAQTSQADPLTDAQVRAATAWYASRARQYTPGVIKSLQEKVGVPQTGKIDPQTLQAVARWQAANTPFPRDGERDAPAFAVNGKADATVLQHLFPTGLATEEQVKAYAGQAKQLIDEWTALGGRRARLSALRSLINDTLKAAGVPPVAVGVDAEGNSGTFDVTTWKVNFNPADLDKDTLNDDEAQELVDTIYHETRHAEQDYQTARMLSGRGLSPYLTMGMAGRVAKLAYKQPLKAGSIEAIKATAMYDSIYGAKGAARNAMYAQKGRWVKERDRLEARVERLEEQLAALEEAQQASTSPQRQARLARVIAGKRQQRDRAAQKLDQARAKVDDYHQQYLNLPEEADAWRTGGRAGAEYRRQVEAERPPARDPILGNTPPDPQEPQDPLDSPEDIPDSPEASEEG